MEEPEDDTKVEEPDYLDLLEDLRVLLNSSKVEQMRYFHTHSKFGRSCSYYQKSKKLFDLDEKNLILALVHTINTSVDNSTDITTPLLEPVLIKGTNND